MKVLLRSNNLVEISFVQACLSENSIESVVLDEHSSAFYAGALMKRRLMVLDEDYDAALRVYENQKQVFDDEIMD